MDYMLARWSQLEIGGNFKAVTRAVPALSTELIDD